MQLQTADMAAKADEAGELLRTLASPHRLMIVCRLIEGNQSVGGLAADLGLQPTLVSQHLAVLRRQHIVETQRRGQAIHYRLVSDVARDIAMTLGAHFCSAPADAASDKGISR